VDILKKDLDVLIVTLFDYLKSIPSTRDQIQDALKEGYKLFIEAEMLTGARKIEEISMVVQPIQFEVTKSTKEKVLGIAFPAFELSQGNTIPSGPRFSLLDTPRNLDESASKIKNALNLIIKLAETEACIREVLDVIAVKKRQINRIEYKILPRLDAAIRYVELIIEEAERQDAIRVRVLQRKRKERAMKRG